MKLLIAVLTVVMYTFLIFLSGAINGIGYRIEKGILEKQIFYDGKMYSVIEVSNEEINE